MSKKEKIPSTPETRAKALADKQEVRKVFKKTFFPALAICLCLLLIYSVSYMAFFKPADITEEGGAAPVNNPVSDNTYNPSPSTDTNTPASDNSSSSNDANANTPANSNSAASNNGGAAASNNANSNSTDAAIQLYKASMAKAKSSAKTVTHTKTSASNYNGIVEAGKLSSAAKTLMDMFMKASEPNEVVDKSELPPKGGANNLTAATIKSATVKEEGAYQIVTITMKDETNPVAGKDGIGAVANVIEESQITGAIGAVPGLSINNINIAYENVVVIAKIEKSTGNLVQVNTNVPCVLSLSAKIPLLGSIDNAKVGILSEDEYIIAW